jgi:hypothetical protein
MSMDFFLSVQDDEGWKVLLITGENLGNCFVYDHFTSLHVSGDGTYGTNCIAYSDTNCQTEMTVSPLTFFLKIKKR